MRDETVFRLMGIGVRFEKQAANHKTLRHTVRVIARGGKREHVHALADVTISIRSGEHVGIIGRNGAGKSTLLRVLARVIDPVKGQVYVKPRLHVIPLLELGIGFQPELTGRENCYLAGFLMGYSRKEISSRITGIMEFSELGEFFDEPVKTYSTGMYARLAFALATDVEPEVLLVDEVFGVGDEFFMRKCIVRMQRLMETGRTMVFVSHNLDFLASQCTRLVWLDQGKVVMDGCPTEIAASYRAGKGLVPC